MSLCVCVCACMSVCVYVYTYSYVGIHMYHLYIYVCMYVYIYTYIHIICIYIYVCTHVQCCFVLCPSFEGLDFELRGLSFVQKVGCPSEVVQKPRYECRICLKATSSFKYSYGFTSPQASTPNEHKSKPYC